MRCEDELFATLFKMCVGGGGGGVSEEICGG